MKKIKLFSTAFMVLLTASVVLIACQKQSAVDNNTSPEVQQLIVTSQSDAEAEVLFNDVFDDVMGVNEDIGLGTGIGIFGSANNSGDDGSGTPAFNPPPCFNVSVTPLAPGVFPKTVVIDFGTGCTGPNGHTRRGKIITVYTGRMIVPGSKATTTFDNYYIDSVKVEGVHITQNNSTSNNRIFTVRVDNGKLTRPSGDYTAWNKNKTRTQTEGNGTPNLPIDDVYSITGTANGTVKRGADVMQWSSEILQPVIRKFTCRWAVKGETKITRNNKTGVLDYGNGACDNKATFTINGTVHNITLH